MFAWIAVAVIATSPLPYTGVNLAGGEFYGPKPGVRPVEGQNYVYPTPAQFEAFAREGMNTFRLPFKWETIQPVAQGPLDPEAIRRLREVVKSATDRRLILLLNPHNYARYYDQLVGSEAVPDAALADFWRRLAKEFKGNDRVWFGLMNEPYGVPATRWVQSANAAIAAIRQTGAKNLILVPGTAYTGAHSWTGDWYGGSNAKAMEALRDPGQRVVIEVHQYLDGDSSGTKPDVVSPTIGSERLAEFVRWCRTHRHRAFLGEFAVGPNEAGRAALKDMLTSMERDRDVWLGFSWWAAGAWWGDYPFSIEPKDGKFPVQMAWLRPHLQPRPVKSPVKAWDGRSSSQVKA